ncbi:MAG: hypothetical protein ACM3JQ_05770 [Candidatus Eiseniibacteriota bacterium]
MGSMRQALDSPSSKHHRKILQALLMVLVLVMKIIMIGENYEMAWLKNRMIRVLVFASVILICSSCVNSESTEVPVELFESVTYQAVPTDMYEISAIEGNAVIKLPSSAHDIHAYTTGMRDISILVRFSMDAKELHDFIKITLCDHPMVHTLPQKVETKFYWWVPDQATDLEQCSGENERSHQQVIIDISDEDEYIVYIRTSTY